MTGQPAAAHGPRDEQAVRQFIERFAAVLSQAGIPLMPARVFVALLTADAPRLTADDIASILRVSPAAVSGAVRYLLPLGLVSRETEPGSRRYWYRTPRDVWHEVVRLRDQMMMRWSQTLRDGLDLFGPDSPAGQRMNESIMYFDFVQKELPMVLSRWEEYRDAHSG
ncbi:MAG: GbsR/MarR family transcriptional regulator [Streptosporangiaceae bacterium]